MFSLFKTEKNCSIGIDFGTSAIKVVELSCKNQKAFLENYGWVDLGLVHPLTLSGLSGMDSQVSYNKKLQKYLQKLIKSMKLQSESAYISLPASSGLVTTIQFPNMNEDELEEAVRFEARKYIPISLDEVALDWEIIEDNTKNENEVKAVSQNQNEQPISEKKNENFFKKDLLKKDSSVPGGKKEILLVGAPKNEVIRCGNIVKESGLNVKNVELELFSLVRSLIGSDNGCFLIIDIGSRITNIILADKGKIRVNRNIEGGGKEITNVISESLNISKQRAEELKKENKDMINSKEMSLSIPILDIISGEAIRIINASKDKISRVDGIIISGGSSKMKGVDTYFSQKIGIKTFVGNPWRRITYEEKLSPFIEKIGNSFSVALGLALRGLEEYGKKD